MILLRCGRWHMQGGRWLIWERLWRKGYLWTPFCRVRRRAG